MCAFYGLFLVLESQREDHEFLYVAQRTSHFNGRILLRFGLHSWGFVYLRARTLFLL
jgi:hypothetical protein